MEENMKILVVDDAPEVLFATSRVVASAGYTVLEAGSGSQCREILAKEQPDLVLLDVMLPDTDGRELCREIKSNPDFKGVFVVLTSGMKTASSDQADGLECGADGYIARPLSNRELKARVDAMVRILSAERDRDRLIDELQEALARVKRLSGLLPYCSYCKKIRDDQGYWQQLEEFVRAHSDAELGDSICPACAKTYYPGIRIYQE